MLGMSLRTSGLKQRVFRAGGWTASSYAVGQLLRFGSNIILTRLLFPEAFGLMMIVQSVITGVALLSDVGLAQSIIRNPRGADTAFLNTAWTIQIAKGFLMALVLWLSAAPVAAFYKQPLLAQLLPVAALAAVFAGFNSTKLALAERNVDARPISLIDLGSLAIGLVASMLLAWHDPSPWALVWGNLLGTVTKLLASHLLLKGARNRLAWDQGAARSILSFGTWVLLSSALTFLSGEGSKLMSAALLDVKLLALLGLATTLNLVLWQAMRHLAGRVMFPAYSEVWRKEPKRFSSVVERSRRVLIGPAWLLAFGLAFLGPRIVNFLYDPRYADAGVILQFLAVGLMVGTLSGSFSGVLWAMGRAKLSTILLVLQVAVQFGCMLLGNALYGKTGVIVGLAGAAWVFYPMQAFVLARIGLWHPRTDLPVVVASTAAVIGVAFTVDWSRALAWH